MNEFNDFPTAPETDQRLAELALDNADSQNPVYWHGMALDLAQRLLNRVHGHRCECRPELYCEEGWACLHCSRQGYCDISADQLVAMREAQAKP